MGTKNSKPVEIPSAECFYKNLKKINKTRREKAGKMTLDKVRSRIASQMKKNLDFLHSQYLTTEETNIIKYELECKGYRVSIDTFDTFGNGVSTQFRWTPVIE